MDITNLTVHELMEKLGNNELTSEEITKAYVDRINDKEKDMIINHMWPVTLYLPKSIEGIILTFVDKYSAMSETFEVMKSRLFMKKTFRYTYAILSLMIIKF